MSAYLVTYALCIATLAMARRYRKINTLYVFFISLSLGGLSLLAGLRADTIGTDLLYYVKRFFIYGQNANSFSDIVALATTNNSEVGYWIWTVLIGKLIPDLHVFLFLTELLIVVLVYKSIQLYEHKLSIVLSMTLFLLLFYNMSFNYVRQFMAMTIVLYSVSYLRKNEDWKVMLLGGVAVLFHNSAVICVIFYAFYFLGKSKTLMKYKMFLFSITVILALFFEKILAFFITHTSFIPNKYVNYFINDTTMSGISFTSVILLVVPVFAIYIYARINSKAKEIGSLDFILLLSMVFNCISTGMFGRMTLYFDIFTYIIIVPCYIRTFNIKAKWVLGGYLLVSITIYWFWYYIIQNYSETFPYQFFWA